VNVSQSISSLMRVYTIGLRVSGADKSQPVGDHHASESSSSHTEIPPHAVPARTAQQQAYLLSSHHCEFSATPSTAIDAAEPTAYKEHPELHAMKTCKAEAAGQLVSSIRTTILCKDRCEMLTTGGDDEERCVTHRRQGTAQNWPLPRTFGPVGAGPYPAQTCSCWTAPGQQLLPLTPCGYTADKYTRELSSNTGHSDTAVSECGCTQCPLLWNHAGCTADEVKQRE
jgi:hypothetical protein